jgi:Flp pilus assembly protein TadG
MRIVSRLLDSTRAASAAEFALVLPLFLILLFGVIDAGRFMWEYNEAEKATQVGARVAIVTDVLSSGLRDEDYAGKTVDGETVGAGDRIPAGALGTLKCTSSGCTCEVTPCPAVGTFDSDTFEDIVVARMKQIYPAIEAENVEVRYSGSGLGTAASSTGGGGGGATESMEVSPLITVTLKDLQFRPITALLFATIDMPSFSTTLTAEDASGAYSN